MKFEILRDMTTCVRPSIRVFWRGIGGRDTELSACLRTTTVGLAFLDLALLLPLCHFDFVPRLVVSIRIVIQSIVV